MGKLVTHRGARRWQLTFSDGSDGSDISARFPAAYIEEGTAKKIVAAFEEDRKIPIGSLLKGTQRTGLWQVNRDRQLVCLGALKGCTLRRWAVGDVYPGPLAEEVRTMEFIYRPGETEKTIKPGTCWRATSGATSGAKDPWVNVDRLRWRGAFMEVLFKPGHGSSWASAKSTLADAIESEALGYWERVPDRNATIPWPADRDTLIGKKITTQYPCSLTPETGVVIGRCPSGGPARDLRVRLDSGDERYWSCSGFSRVLLKVEEPPAPPKPVPKRGEMWEGVGNFTGRTYQGLVTQARSDGSVRVQPCREVGGNWNTDFDVWEPSRIKLTRKLD